MAHSGNSSVLAWLRPLHCAVIHLDYLDLLESICKPDVTDKVMAGKQQTAHLLVRQDVKSKRRSLVIKHGYLGTPCKPVNIGLYMFI